MVTFAIRDAVESDSSSIAALISDLGYPTTESEMRERLGVIAGDPHYRTLIAQVGAVVVGVAGVEEAHHFYERAGYKPTGLRFVKELGSKRWGAHHA